MKHVQRFFLSIFLLAFTGTCLAVPAGVNWQWANPKPQGNSFNAVAYNPLGFTVAVGDLGNVVSSSDAGVNWTVQNSNATQNLNAIYTDVDTAFIAVGDGGTIITETAVGSPPQLTGIWVDFTDGSLTADLNGIVKGNVAGSDLFVAVGDNGTVFTNDGSSLVWTARTSPAGTGDLTAVTWSSTLTMFAAVSDSGKIISSFDGLNWTFRASVSEGFNDIFWTGNKFVAVGSLGLIETSTNGSFWVQSNPAATSSFFTLRSVAKVGSKLVAVGRFGIYISNDDGGTWTLQPEADGRELNAITSFDSTFLAVTRGGQILTGTDGVNWTRRLPVNSLTENLKNERIEDIVWNGSQFLAVGGLLDSGNTTTLLSMDGINWTANSSATGAPTDSVIWDGGQFVGVSNKFVYSSADGITWDSVSVAPLINLKAIAFDGTQYIVVGNSGVIYTSTDLVNWTPRLSASANLNSVASNGTTTVAAGEMGTLIISIDGGANWTIPTMPVIGSSDIFDVLWNDEQFVAVGENGLVITSSDGNNWTSQSSGLSERLRGITWDSKQFIAVSDLGTVITSPDGVTWTSQTSITSNVLTAVAGTNTRLVAVGWDGTIVISAGTIDTIGSGSGGGGGGVFNLYLLLLLSTLLTFTRRKQITMALTR